ncbi:hypothetical protein [Pseudogemmobacter faecipullorum]|uniref:Uncharacterized protein n=1 Tax=Pseudogemmobacter faecipullorum TaxID=2755041 RepID=A0ABS8CKS9_9RHOB|nr:hypothetical protein [Pseudogemmobacter faecipullorum]MCB5409986.1 hypothetical protein [Pseudogemmobacter faecipullorum]
MRKISLSAGFILTLMIPSALQAATCPVPADSPETCLPGMIWDGASERCLLPASS